uniref:uncharacterized protein LOC122607281 n=1 Tax=Erigeron canadensis TaxID=72917 RepID=UPI001CB8CDD4|nr:uncharacterized protein LOC122607281 [Erigeron canadensis]
MEVENKGKPPSFPSNYVTIHQLRQRWLQQHQSPCSLPTTVIPESNHRDNGDVVDSSSSSSSTAVSQKPQNDAVYARSPPPPPPVTKSPSSSSNTKNRRSSSLSTESDHRDNDDVVESSKRNPQNDTVSARFSKSPSSYYSKNKTPFSSISSSSSGGGFNKKAQSDVVSPFISKQNPQKNRIASGTLKETIFGKSRGPHRAPEVEPKHTDTMNNNNTNLDSDYANDVTDNQLVLKKKKRKNKKKNLARVILPDQSVTGGESGESGGGREPNEKAVGESEQVVELERKQKPRDWNKKRVKEFKDKTASFDQNKPGVGDDNPELEKKGQLRESKGRRNLDKKGVREFKDKTPSFDQNKHAIGDNAVESEAKPELEVGKGQESPELGGFRKLDNKAVRESKMGQELEEVVVVEIPMETRGRPDLNKKSVWEYKPKTAPFGQYDSNNSVDSNVGNGDVVKENSRHASTKLDHQGQGQGQGKQSLKAASFDQDQDMSETAAKERDAVNTSNYYHRNRNATGNGGSNWRMGSGRFRGQGIQRLSYSKPLVSTRKGDVWVKKGESIKPTLSSS